MRVNIWIPDRELERIDAYCKKNGHHRGVFLWKAAIDLIGRLEGEAPEIKCDYCKSKSIGRYKITAYTDQGEKEVVKYLCKLHYKQARREGDIRKAKQ